MHAIYELTKIITSAPFIHACALHAGYVHIFHEEKQLCSPPAIYQRSPKPTHLAMDPSLYVQLNRILLLTHLTRCTHPCWISSFTRISSQFKIVSNVITKFIHVYAAVQLNSTDFINYNCNPLLQPVTATSSWSGFGVYFLAIYLLSHSLLIIYFPVISTYVLMSNISIPRL